MGVLPYRVFIFGFLVSEKESALSELNEPKSIHSRCSIKKCHFDIPKVYFIIFPHHFTTFHLLDVLSFNSIY